MSTLFVISLILNAAILIIPTLGNVKKETHPEGHAKKKGVRRYLRLTPLGWVFVVLSTGNIAVSYVLFHRDRIEKVADRLAGRAVTAVAVRTTVSLPAGSTDEQWREVAENPGNYLITTTIRTREGWNYSVGESSPKKAVAQVWQKPDDKTNARVDWNQYTNTRRRDHLSYEFILRMDDLKFPAPTVGEFDGGQVEFFREFPFGFAPHYDVRNIQRLELVLNPKHDEIRLLCFDLGPDTWHEVPGSDRPVLEFRRYKGELKLGESDSCGPYPGGK